MSTSLARYALVACLLTGCASNLTVKVERIEPNGQLPEKFTRVNDYDLIVEQQIAAINHYLAGTGRIEEMLGSEHVQSVESYVDAVESKVGHLRNEGVELTVKLTPYQITGTVPSELATAVMNFRSKVALFLLEEDKVWTEFGQGFEQGSDFGGKISNEVAAISGVRNQLQEAKQISGSSRVGYQGFIVDDIFKISPSDPNYASVLAGTPVSQAISEVKATSLGDSTVLFVQESPGQMRIYQVETDTEQLVQNALFIFDKSLSAAIKYMGPVPATATK
jgi:hypothetical protein